MRDAFFSELAALFRADTRVVFLTADLGYKLFDPLLDIDANRVMNVGIREAAMVGFAAGLAKGGMLPFIYSIVPFLSLRCLEQIKLDLCYNEARVIVVGVGGGYAYGFNGPTHHGVDDVGVLSCLPNLRIWTPCDPGEVRACVREAPQLAGPAYLRLGRNGESNLCGGTACGIDHPIVLAGDAGADVTVITCGVLAAEAVAARKCALEKGITLCVVHLPTLRPFPTDAVQAILANGKPVITCEEHVVSGGLGHCVAALMAQNRMSNRLTIRAIPDVFQGACLSRQSALAWAGIDAAAIVGAATRMLQRE